MELRAATRERGLTLVVLANLLWGTVFIASSVGLRYANPYVLVFLRFVAASAGVVLLALPLGWLPAVASELRRKVIWALGSIYALGFLIQYMGQAMTSAADATLLSNLAPVLTPIVAYVMIREKVPKVRAVGTMVGFLGLLLVGAPKVSFSSIVGDGLLFCTSLSYAFLLVILKRTKVESVASSLALMVTVMFYLIPTALFPGGLSLSSLYLPGIAWLSVFFMGIPCGTVAIALFFKGQGTLPSTTTATLLLVQLVVGLALAAVLLGETLSMPELIGAFLIIAAVAISSRSG
jgi:drug/metabolite transporter (DMT)-like permease